MSKFKIPKDLKIKYLRKKILLSEEDMLTFIKYLENPPPPNKRLKAAMIAHRDMLKEENFLKG